ncbi:histidine ammonia-lyase [Paraliomyxa miuraensis]|uniref:histidine ammonia-lyase n=1 Tax=Paraliomyxa miuraensis TaxID=376150 RepID=UPI002256F07D|nr:histidine ammonia-lyase [Paraliomyxa miuraensis]MCX4244560.1 histidine ammonia-lyase [Paraliomyxa miuraensis]
MSGDLPSTVTIGRRLDLAEVVQIARGRASVALHSDARERLSATRARLEQALHDGRTIYGVNTGFGALSDTTIPGDKLVELQRNLLRSHAVGVGEPLPADVVRALLALRAHTLALGHSAVTPALLDQLLGLLHAGVVPVVPSQGSVGASGDLAPLAHLALPLIGEGWAWIEGKRMSGGEALAAVGMQPHVLGAKEGLALINGTQVTSVIGGLAAVAAAELLASADAIGALSLDASLGTLAAFDPRIHAGKPHPGQQRTADNVRALVTSSPLNASHADCGQVQDAYAYRCMPQVHGAVRGALRYVVGALTIELNSLTDNPLVLPDGKGAYDVVSGGNFHAATVAVPIDHLSAAMTTLATISERRLERFMNVHTSRGLPPFLADDPGLESGFMMAQVTASALASECKTLSFPASVDSIPTSAGKEDHVSMGPIAALKLRRVVDNVARCLAIEAAVAARAVDLRKVATSERLQRVHEAVRQYVRPWSGDRSLSEELEALAEAMMRGELREAAQLPDELT